MMQQNQADPRTPPLMVPQRTPRQVLLETALKITSQDRNKQYGNPEDNFQNIANRWNLYLCQRFPGMKIPALQPIDVAFMMIDMKMARLGPNPTHQDSLVDVAGYAACAADCQANMVNYANEQVPKQA